MINMGFNKKLHLDKVHQTCTCLLDNRFMKSQDKHQGWHKTPVVLKKGLKVSKFLKFLQIILINRVSMKNEAKDNITTKEGAWMQYSNKTKAQVDKTVVMVRLLINKEPKKKRC